MRKKRFIPILLTLVLAFTSLSACDTSGQSSSDEGSVYYLNYKPEQDAQWQELAEYYTEETGVPVTVLTAASGQYETTLKSEMAKSDAPTAFQVANMTELEAWQDYAYDLTDTKLAEESIDESFRLSLDDEIKAIAYVMESYGIIYNKDLLAEAGYTQDDIMSFDGLKDVAEDITARKDELGFAAFTSVGMDSSSDWRFHTHLANFPVYYEMLDRGLEIPPESLEGTYTDNFRKIWDLYINNSTVEPSLLSSMTGEDAVSEFLTEEAVFYQNGSWAYTDIADLGDEKLGMIPIYMDVAGEEDNSPTTGTGNYWVVNKKASAEDIEATLDFLEWCVTSEVGVKAMCGIDGAMPSGEEGMGFSIPFKSNIENDNKLLNITNEYLEKGYEPVQIGIVAMPSEQWKQDLGSAMTLYAAEQTDENWAEVETAFVDNWAKEAAASE